MTAILQLALLIFALLMAYWGGYLDGRSIGWLEATVYAEKMCLQRIEAIKEEYE